MKKTRILSLLLALVMLVGVLVACDSPKVPESTGDPSIDGSWDSVDFNGQEVNFCISINKYDECMFPAANIYTKGPDTAGSNEVAKEVLARNKAAAETLGITVKYTTRDLVYKEILEDIQKPF